MTWHDISQPTTLPHLTSPQNQPHYFTSPRSQPHDITRHITAHYTTTETQPATTKTPPPDGTAEGWCAQKTRFGHPTGWSPCAHSIGKFSLWFTFFSLKFPPPARELLELNIACSASLFAPCFAQGIHWTQWRQSFLFTGGRYGQLSSDYQHSASGLLGQWGTVVARSFSVLWQSWKELRDVSVVPCCCTCRTIAVPSHASKIPKPPKLCSFQVNEAADTWHVSVMFRSCLIAPACCVHFDVSHQVHERAVLMSIFPLWILRNAIDSYWTEPVVCSLLWSMMTKAGWEPGKCCPTEWCIMPTYHDIIYSGFANQHFCEAKHQFGVRQREVGKIHRPDGQPEWLAETTWPSVWLSLFRQFSEIFMPFKTGPSISEHLPYRKAIKQRLGVWEKSIRWNQK